MSFVNNSLAQDVLLSNVFVVSGMRTYGRTIDTQTNGRQNQGLLFVRHGEATFYPTKGKTIKVSDGQLLYIPKAYRYKMQYTALETDFVVVNFNLTDDNCKDVSLYKEITLVLPNDPSGLINAIMKKLEQCGTTQSLSGLFRCKELLYRLLAILCEHHELQPEKQPYSQIQKGVHLLKETYLENLPIPTFAAHANVSVSSFRSLFRKQYGMSPVQYRNWLRINRARQLLEEGDCTVAEAAYASGFDNLGYFCRYYKQVTGQTPSQTKQPTR